MLRPAVQALLALALCSAEAQSSVRQWKLNTNMDDVGNWNTTVLCSNDRLVFPADVKAVVFVQRNYTLQEVRLPNNGIMLFEEGASLMFSSIPDRRRGCTRQGKELKFSAGTPRSWFDSKNWCVGQGCADDNSPATYVDSEIVPCQNNDVIFPEKSTFSIDVHSNPEPIRVKNVVLRGSIYNNSATFGVYFNGEVGLKEFVTTEKGTRSRIAISSSGCTDLAGCVCGNTHEYMEELVCAGRQCSPSLPCPHPVKADGNCCPSCGTLLKVTTGNNFNMTYFKQVLAGAIVETKPVLDQTVRWAVTKVTTSELQVLTLPSRSGGSTADGSSAIDLGCLINDFLLRRAAELQLGVTNILAVNSDGLSCDKHPSYHASTQAETSRDVVIGVMIALAVIVVIGVLIFVYRKSLYWKVQALKSSLTIQRVRFDGKTAKWETFENPAYDGVPLPFSPSDSKTAVAFDARSQTIIGFENPLYPESGAAFNPEAAGEPVTSAAAGTSPFFDSLPAGLSAGRSGGRAVRSTTAAGIGFDNPLCTGQNGTRDANASQTSNGTHVVAAPLAATASSDRATVERAERPQSWISKFRLPKLFAPAASHTASTTKAVDEKGFSNPLYQSPTVETLSFSPTGVAAYTPAAASQLSPGGRISGRVGGAGPLLDDDFLNGAVGGHASASDTAELIL